MEEFIANNFTYVLLSAVFIILILIGYMVDKARINKVKSEYEKKAEASQLNIPISNAIDTNTNDIVSVNNETKDNN